MLLTTLALGLGAANTEALFAAQDAISPDTKPWMDDHISAHLQNVLGFSDQEWPVVSQKIEPVLHLIYQRERFTRTKLPKPSKEGKPHEISSGGGIVAVKNDPGRVPDRGSANADMGQSFFRLISLASQASPSTGDVKAALSDYRAARAKSDAELTQARSSLRELMSFKQEAALVVMGILD
jgi:hypothetical protein